MADTKKNQSTKKKVDLTPTENNNIFLFDIEVPAESVKDAPKPKAPKKPAPQQPAKESKPTGAKKPSQSAQKPAPKKRPAQEKKLNEVKGEPKKLAKEKKGPSLEKEEVITPSKKKPKKAPPVEKPEEKESIKIPYVNKKPATKRDFSDGAKAVKNATKDLPKVLAWFIPTQNDKMEELIRKGLVIICIIVLIFSMGILIKSTRLEKKASEDNAGSQFVNKYVYSYEIYDKSDKEK